MERQPRELRWWNVPTYSRLSCITGLMLSVCVCAGSSVWAQGNRSVAASTGSENLSSRSVARLFYQQAFDLACCGDPAERDLNKAVPFLMAARELNPRLTDASLLLFDIASRTNQAYLEPIVREWLFACPANVMQTPGVHKAVRYLIGRQSQQGGMERLIVQLQQFLGDGHPILDSELLTHMGLVARQRPDQRGADLYFSRAYERNKYNKVAFSQLSELAPDRIDPSLALEHLRLAIRENPLDLDSAIAFAQYAERLGLFDISAGSYAYCADVFAYLYEEKPLPGYIYIPWAISTYNSATHVETVADIAEGVRKAGTFDIFLEAIAGRALLKAGKDQAAATLLQAAETRAQELLVSGPSAADPNTATVQPKALAWYYCFGREDPEPALDWANKAYTLDPNGPATQALLAYALVLNEQYRWALPIIDKGPTNQISELARGRLLLANGQTEAGLKVLQAAVGRDAGSLAADQGRRLLAKYQQPYTPTVKAQNVLGALVNSLGDHIVPEFSPPHEMLKAKLGTTNTAIPFGGSLGGILTIINQSNEPLIIGPRGLFQGRIRVDAQVSGALTRTFADLVTLDLFGAQAVAPHRSTTAQLPLIVGPLRQLLHAHPQASLNIEFRVYLDPAQREDGSIWNRLVDVEPVRLEIGRPGVKITEKSLRTKYNAIALTDSRTKIQTAKLFVGLLKEQQIMAEEGVLYKFRYADWMPGWLSSALTDPAGLLLNVVDNDWEVKVHTLNTLEGLDLHAGLLEILGQNLQDPHWPVRFCTVGLIAANPTPGFNRVLAWSAKHDVHPLVRNLATLLAEQTQDKDLHGN